MQIKYRIITDYIVIAARIIFLICKYTFNFYFLLIIFITTACPVSWSFVSSRYCLQTCNMHSSSQQQVVYMSKFITKKNNMIYIVELKIKVSKGSSFVIVNYYGSPRNPFCRKHAKQTIHFAGFRVQNGSKCFKLHGTVVVDKRYVKR